MGSKSECDLYDSLRYLRWLFCPSSWIVGSSQISTRVRVLIIWMRNISPNVDLTLALID